MITSDQPQTARQMPKLRNTPNCPNNGNFYQSEYQRIDRLWRIAQRYHMPNERQAVVMFKQLCDEFTYARCDRMNAVLTASNSSWRITSVGVCRVGA